MAKYGNILALIDANQAQKDAVELLLKLHQTNYRLVNDVYFVETNSKVNTKNLVEDLNLLNLTFIFFHNNISDGSYAKYKGIDANAMAHIHQILFM